MLIYMDKIVHRFATLQLAQDYAKLHCRGTYEFYVIVDTEKDEVVDKWSY